jgi:hypothetical protein
MKVFIEFLPYRKTDSDQQIFLQNVLAFKYVIKVYTSKFVVQSVILHIGHTLRIILVRKQAGQFL